MLQMVFMGMDLQPEKKLKYKNPTKMKFITKIISAILPMITPLWTIPKNMPIQILITTVAITITTV